jgi:hypothetical protein
MMRESLPSLEEYILVAQTARKVEVFRRSTNWQGEVYESGDAFMVHGASITVDAMPSTMNEVRTPRLIDAALRRVGETPSSGGRLTAESTQSSLGARRARPRSAPTDDGTRRHGDVAQNYSLGPRPRRAPQRARTRISSCSGL